MRRRITIDELADQVEAIEQDRAFPAEEPDLPEIPISFTVDQLPPDAQRRTARERRRRQYLKRYKAVRRRRRLLAERRRQTIQRDARRLQKLLKGFGKVRVVDLLAS